MNWGCQLEFKLKIFSLFDKNLTKQQEVRFLTQRNIHLILKGVRCQGNPASMVCLIQSRTSDTLVYTSGAPSAQVPLPKLEIPARM